MTLLLVVVAESMFMVGWYFLLYAKEHLLVAVEQRQDIVWHFHANKMRLHARIDSMEEYRR